ncbi:MAG: site-specific integrase, partial [Eubacteriales bacterium]|nr:site-specific integrase [Eubacteriales bacterium]
MSVYKNPDSGTWYSICWFTDWKGVRKQKCRRGFTTKREALEWEREFLMQRQADVYMTFDSFVQLYEKDIKPKLKLNTWLTKESIIQKKILPYFKDRKLSEITAKDIMDWQNEIRSLTDSKGKQYSTTYLKTVHNQFSCIFNHAIKYYGLQINPAARAGNMGSEEKKEMLFWTKAEYLKFIDAMMDKPLSFYAFEMLYWCGIREGELLALTPADFDFTGSSVYINKSYQRLKGQDIITTPKTKKSNRVIKMSQFLCDEMQEYIKMFYSAGKSDRIFPVTKHYLKHEMERGCKETGVKRIKIHDIRHSHVSLLIDMGFTALAIADRVGHESIDITYRYAHLFPT